MNPGTALTTVGPESHPAGLLAESQFPSFELALSWPWNRQPRANRRPVAPRLAPTSDTVPAVREAYLPTAPARVLAAAFS